MDEGRYSPEDLKLQSNRSAHGTSSWLERLARFGFLAKGAVYILVGILAAIAAMGSSQAEGSEGALASLAGSPLGQALLGLIALGLFGYAIWRLVAAFTDPENEGVPHRIYYAITALLHGALGVEAARLALNGQSAAQQGAGGAQAAAGGGQAGAAGAGAGGAQGAAGGDEASHWTAEVMSQPFGVWLVTIGGAVIAAFGLYQLYRAYAVKLDEDLNLAELDPQPRRWAVALSRFGLAARGVVFSVIGVTVLIAGLEADPSEAVGVAGALRTLEQQAYGPWILGAVALGLIAYGVYQLIRARYKRIATA